VVWAVKSGATSLMRSDMNHPLLGDFLCRPVQTSGVAVFDESYKALDTSLLSHPRRGFRFAAEANQRCSAKLFGRG
jgi:hypothetical protein